MSVVGWLLVKPGGWLVVGYVGDGMSTLFEDGFVVFFFQK